MRDGPQQCGWVAATTRFPERARGPPLWLRVDVGLPEQASVRSWGWAGPLPGPSHWCPSAALAAGVGTMCGLWPRTCCTRSRVRRAAGRGLRACQTRPAGWRGGGRQRPLKGTGLSPRPLQPLGAAMPPAPQPSSSPPNVRPLPGGRSPEPAGPARNLGPTAAAAAAADPDGFPRSTPPEAYGRARGGWRGNTSARSFSELFGSRPRGRD